MPGIETTKDFWMVNSQIVGNGPDSRFNLFRVITCSWQRRASWFYWSRWMLSQIQCINAHKSTESNFLSFKLCLNAQYCHKKVLVEYLLLSYWWASVDDRNSSEKFKAQKLLSPSVHSGLRWLHSHFIVWVSLVGETNGFTSHASFIKDYSKHRVICICTILFSL